MVTQATHDRDEVDDAEMTSSWNEAATVEANLDSIKVRGLLSLPRCVISSSKRLSHSQKFVHDAINKCNR